MDSKDNTTSEISDKYNHLRYILERASPFAPPDFTPGLENLLFIQNTCKVLVIGAGGLGCELLKNLALLGFRNINVIDMDTIDLSNLNRQFLFRPSDIGKPKAEVAAAFINSRISQCNVIPHFAQIQDFDSDFYRSFHIIVCGLDSIIARRWINGLLVSMLSYDDGELDMSTVIPLVDGGTEGFKGNARVIIPGLTACVECTLDYYPPQINYPLCTIAHTPRLPEHCIEYVRILLWPKENLFGEGLSIDGDNPEHIRWILQKSLERADQFNITGINYRLTQGVIKNIIPAVASTNAVIAAVCATEVLKIAVSCYLPLNNYMNFNNTDAIYTYAFEAERKSNCAVCSQIQQSLSFFDTNTLQEIIDYLQNDKSYQLKSPGLITQVSGKNKTLYMSTVKSIQQATKPNLKKTLKELQLIDGQLLYVADPTCPNNLIFKLKIISNNDSKI